MWPFGKTEKKKSDSELQHDELKEFDALCGGKFSYLGVDYTIVGYSRYYPRIGSLPGLRCHYRGNEGTVNNDDFDMLEFASIKKHAVYKNK
jgi:hypothetical protein